MSADDLIKHAQELAAAGTSMRPPRAVTPTKLFFAACSRKLRDWKLFFTSPGDRCFLHRSDSCLAWPCAALHDGGLIRGQAIFLSGRSGHEELGKETISADKSDQSEYPMLSIVQALSGRRSCWRSLGMALRQCSRAATTSASWAPWWCRCWGCWRARSCSFPTRRRSVRATWRWRSSAGCRPTRRAA